MKRSEMIGVMLEIYRSYKSGKWSGVTDEEVFTEILTSMEICGMRPPCNAWFGGHGHLEMDGSCSDNVASCDNTWEKE
jgi:hypothetical protein